MVVIALALGGTIVVLRAGTATADQPMTAQPSANTTLLELDALHTRRDDPAALARAHTLATALLAKTTDDYAVLWRAARVLFTESDDQKRASDERARLAKQAFDVAERAVAAAPNAVEGYYWGALAVGSYGSTMGIVRAVAHGIEGKFTRMLGRAAQIDGSYDHGGVPVTWAAYYLELPWPKRDRGKAASECRRALAINPASLRARLYLARIAADEDRRDEARRWLEEIAAASVGRYDPPEERAVKREAATLRATLR